MNKTHTSKQLKCKHIYKSCGISTIREYRGEYSKGMDVVAVIFCEKCGEFKKKKLK